LTAPESTVLNARYVCFALAATLMLAGCATLRLSGCVRLAQCGELASYSCEGDLVCADAEGQTIRAERLYDSRTPCRVCPTEK